MIHVYELAVLSEGGKVGGGVTPGQDGCEVREHCSKRLQPTDRVISETVWPFCDHRWGINEMSGEFIGVCDNNPHT